MLGKQLGRHVPARWFALTGVLALTAAVFVFAPGQPRTSDASSHRDSPLILEDPTADNTDVYAFVSTEPGRADFVTLIANFIPLEEPSDGPNFFLFSPGVFYNIHIDLNGDAQADLTYRWRFQTTIVNGNTFLYNTGKIGLPPNPTDPTSPYPNLNLRQTYTLVEQRPGPPRRDGPGVIETVLLQNARVAPNHVGPTSTGTVAEYEALAAAAVHTVPGQNGMRVFAGQRDEGFYVDLVPNTTFDATTGRTPPGKDATAGFNVHTIALEIPKSKFTSLGATGTIGVWSTAQRTSLGVLTTPGGQPVQVSRLGFPLVNEVLVPLRAKDQYQQSNPANDAAFLRDFIVNPGTSQGPLALIPVLNSLLGGQCAPTTGRVDLELAILKGIDASTAQALASVVPSLAPFAQAGGNQIRPNPVLADMIRLNYTVPPSMTPNRLGLLGGDPAGFPNGRRVGDDVLDIDLKAAAGAILHVLGAINCPASLTLGDNVDGNDLPYLPFFPYLATPHRGFDRVHQN